MKTLYISDLDGTLLRNDGRSSPFTRRVVAELARREIPFTVATARSAVSAAAVTEGLDLRVPRIVYNGTFLVSPEGEAVEGCVFEPETAARIEALLASCGLHPLVYALAGGRERVLWEQGRESAAVRRYLAKRRGDVRLWPQRERATLLRGETFYFTCIDDREAVLRPAYELLRGLPGCRCLLQREPLCEEYWLELYPAQAGKARAALRLKERLGCERMVCFGDGLNDLPLIEAADLGCAVANAAPALRAAADVLLESNESDGVARWLLAHALGGVL